MCRIPDDPNEIDRLLSSIEVELNRIDLKLHSGLFKPERPESRRISPTKRRRLLERQNKLLLQYHHLLLVKNEMPKLPPIPVLSRV